MNVFIAGFHGDEILNQFKLKRGLQKIPSLSRFINKVLKKGVNIQILKTNVNYKYVIYLSNDHFKQR